MRWRTLRHNWTILLLAMIAVPTAILLRLGPHLLWRLGPDFEPNTDVAAVPVRPMPEETIPDEFTRIRLGTLAASVPFGMVKRPEFRGGGMPGVLLRDGTREVFISLPMDHRAVLAAYRAELANRGGLSTLPAVQAEIYATRPSDFRWSMSSEELARHQWLLKQAPIVRAWSVQAVETRLGGEPEGLLLIRDPGAAFEWVGEAGAASGVVLFDQRPRPIDLRWVRAVCRSLHYEGGVYGEGMTAEAVGKLFRAE